MKTKPKLCHCKSKVQAKGLCFKHYSRMMYGYYYDVDGKLVESNKYKDEKK